MNDKKMRILVSIAVISLLGAAIWQTCKNKEAARQAAIVAAYNDSIEAIVQAKRAEQRRLAAIEQARQDSIERAEHAAFAKKYPNIGLIITEVEMTRGKDKDGDLTKGLSFRIFNPTKKKIKYVIASMVAINAVDDVMSYEKTCRGIGPVDSYDYGSWSFDDVFYDKNDVIDDLRVSFRVIYTNGTSKTVRVKDALYKGHFHYSWFE